MSEESPETVPVETRAPDTSQERGSSALRFLKELPVLIALALAIALLMKAFIVQAFYIQQQSMEPTLHEGNRVLVSKLHYRFGHPHRGDVVILRDPRNPCGSASAAGNICHRNIARRAFNWVVEVFGLPAGGEQDLVKRIVGLPGETLEMKDGNIYVCSRPGCHPLDSSGRPQDGHLVELSHSSTKGPQKDDANVPEVSIPADHYFVLGDNRAASADSRIFGAVDRRQLVGKAFVVVWPPGHWETL